MLAEIELIPFKTYAPLISNDVVRTLFSHAALKHSIVEEENVKSRYLYGQIGCNVFIEQTTNSTEGEKCRIRSVSSLIYVRSSTGPHKRYSTDYGTISFIIV